VCGVLGLMVYALAPSLSVLTVAAVSLGLSSAAVEMGVQAVVGERTALDQRGAAMAGWNAVTGARGIVAPFLATGLVAAGVIGVTGGFCGGRVSRSAWSCSCGHPVGASADTAIDRATVPARATGWPGIRRRT
jgi:MFS family permease